ncbi:MAG: hypothetical protein WC297_01720 [Candidatus Paceibacterota bacterium]|jgi:hypothetical protein
MKIRNLVLAVIVFLFSSSLVLAAEEKTLNNQQIFQRVAEKMNIQLVPEIPLPKIEMVSPDGAIEATVKVMVRDFKGTPFWKSMGEKSQEEIIKELKDLLAQAKSAGDYELVYDNGLYDPYANIIYLVNGCSMFTRVHEIAHYLQVKYQKKYPESNEAFKNVSEKQRQEILESEGELEEEASKIAEEVCGEFSPQVLAKAP